MQIPVLIERVAGNGFQARATSPFTISAEGATRDEALGKLRALIQDRLVGGSEVVSLDIPAAENPWLAMAGMWEKNDPLVREWKETMAEQRKEADADPEGP